MLLVIGYIKITTIECMSPGMAPPKSMININKIRHSGVSFNVLLSYYSNIEYTVVLVTVTHTLVV